MALRLGGELVLGHTYHPGNEVTIYSGDCMDLLRTIPDGAAGLVVTSPPYNIGKAYEKAAVDLDTYISGQAMVIREAYRILDPRGSMCWQVGNHVVNSIIAPLDILLYPIFAELGLHLRNRIVWHYEHGLHCRKRFSGRYETILWFTKADRDYVFNLDPVRVPQKYPGKKYFKGPKVGQYSCNPLGKNPGDVWTIPNVKHNHVEKTDHPCQFPVELVERLILSMTEENALVVDPYIGAGSTAIAALLHSRRAAGAEIVPKYAALACNRVRRFIRGDLKLRRMGTPVYSPGGES